MAVGLDEGVRGERVEVGIVFGVDDMGDKGNVDPGMIVAVVERLM